MTVDSQAVDKIGQMEICPEGDRTYVLGVDLGTHVETRQVQVTVSGAAQVRGDPLSYHADQASIQTKVRHGKPSLNPGSVPEAEAPQATSAFISRG